MKFAFFLALLLCTASLQPQTVTKGARFKKTPRPRAAGAVAAPSTIFVSDLSWSSMVNGWGPAEKDMSNGEQLAGDGHAITLRTATFAKGIGAHALSNIQYDLTNVGACTTFQATIGVDDESAGLGSVTFEVWGDGVKIYNSPILTGLSAAVTINVNITGHPLLTMIVGDGGDGIAHDHADWANARVTCTTAAPPAPTSSITMPSDAGVINVKTGYGAVGDGVHDDTANIQSAISSNIDNRDSIMYFPAGTYLVSNTIWCYNNGAPHIWGGYITFQGAGESLTIIKLKNSSSGYGSSGVPKAVLFTASSGAGDTSSNPTGGGNAAFNNYIFDLTINTGTGNPGAIAIDFLGTNNARINHVTLQSGDGAGVAGISSSRNYPGPEFFSNITVIGFATAIDVSGGNVSATMEHIRISGQTTAGITVGGNSGFIRDFISSNLTMPAITTGEFTLVVVIDATMSGGSPTLSAINGGGNSAQMYVRNASSSGYQSTVKWQGNVVAGSTQAEYYTAPIQSQFSPVKTLSLGLPVQPFPVYYDPQIANWLNVQSFGALTNGSDAASSIQAALNACTGTKTTVYFPHGTYRIGTTLNVAAGSTCKRLVGYGASIIPVSAGAPSNGTAITYLATAGTLVIEHLNFNNDTAQFATAISHTGTGKLAIQESHMDGRYIGGPGAGDIFLDDMAFGAFIVGSGQNFWSRQLDCEGDSGHFQNGGGTAWILGLTTEDTGTVVTSTAGSTTEILGASILLHSGSGSDTSNYAMTSSDASVSYVYATTGDFVYTHQISETRSGVTRTIDCDGAFVCGSLPSRVHGTAVPLYTGY